MSKDILKKLSLAETIKLCEFYENYKETLPYIYTYIRQGLEWRRKEPEKYQIEFFVIDDEWEHDGTFISYGHFPWKMLMLYTFENNAQKIENALMLTNRFDYKKYLIFFYAIHMKHVPIVDRAMFCRSLRKTTHTETDFWKLDADNKITTNYSCPEEFTMMQLNPEDAIFINENWVHKSSDSEGYIRMLIEMNGGYGVYNNSDNSLIAWILKTQLGQLGLVQVLPEYRRKGLAEILVCKLSAEIQEMGLPVLATVVTNNVASQKLFEKLGFKSTFICAFMTYK